MRKYVNIGISLPAELLEKVDAKAKEIAQENGTEPNRSAVIRRALLKFLRGGDN